MIARYLDESIVFRNFPVLKDWLKSNLKRNGKMEQLDAVMRGMEFGKKIFPKYEPKFFLVERENRTIIYVYGIALDAPNIAAVKFVRFYKNADENKVRMSRFASSPYYYVDGEDGKKKCWTVYMKNLKQLGKEQPDETILFNIKEEEDIMESLPMRAASSLKAYIDSLPLTKLNNDREELVKMAKQLGKASRMFPSYMPKFISFETQYTINIILFGILQKTYKSEEARVTAHWFTVDKADMHLFLYENVTSDSFELDDEGKKEIMRRYQDAVKALKSCRSLMDYHMAFSHPPFVRKYRKGEKWK